jgi:hypothetical protein
MPLRPATNVYISDVDVPLGFKLDGKKSYSFVDDQVRRAHLKYTGSASTRKVIRFFLDQMPIRNWKLTSQAANFGTTDLHFVKGSEMCTVSTHRSFGTTYIVIQLGKRPD